MNDTLSTTASRKRLPRPATWTFILYAVSEAASEEVIKYSACADSKDNGTTVNSTDGRVRAHVVMTSIMRILTPVINIAQPLGNTRWAKTINLFIATITSQSYLFTANPLSFWHMRKNVILFTARCTML